ncbi:hypothetical protein QBC47DRAFT_375214 [Echria macrotheca]|uniref:Methyltransferase domain-containing protein n=1 Tax=Echria macrotheca TaxID=438768 RepID=A0AAJ0F921_9PEZI|nr:hypothetical protein QBC47DRAFT_375214 [Echria macrotheca]
MKGRGWYDVEGGETPSPPSTADIKAYTALFSPLCSPQSALKSFTSNARKSSIRASVAAHLTSKRYIHPSYAHLLNLPKSSKSSFSSIPQNPYLDFWTWTCHHLSWCGPLPLPRSVSPPRIKSHPILPILMHHFGCAVPTHEALTILSLLCGPSQKIADIGSGSGYWTFLLRQYLSSRSPSQAVLGIDNAQSLWRTTWIADTVITPGTTFLSSLPNHKDIILLMVYPIVGGAMGAGGTEGQFTRDLVAAYNGDVIAVVGTQNHNGYTSFRDMTVDEFMEREHGDQWERIVQVPLPSFAGKDEALFVFRRRDHQGVEKGESGN